MEYCLRREISQKASPGYKYLDLMAGYFTYIPEYVKASEIIGVGLNREELSLNKRLTGYISQDLNENPALSFEDCSFDIITLTSGMAYLKNPEILFHSVGRLLKPDGILFVSYTDRQYDNDATELWGSMTPHEKTIFTRNSILSVTDHFDVYQKIFLYDTRNKSNNECARLDLYICSKRAMGTKKSATQQASLTIESYDALSASKCLVPLIENRIFSAGNYTVHYNASEFDHSNVARLYLNDNLLNHRMVNAGIFISLLPFYEEIDSHGPLIKIQCSEFQK